MSADQAQILIKLDSKSKNHLGSMYFGALCVGADLAGGIQLMRILGKEIKQVSFAFKDVAATFLKRAEGDVLFVCESGQIVADLIEKARQTMERESAMVQVYAIVPKRNNDIVAEFSLTLSFRFR